MSSLSISGGGGLAVASSSGYTTQGIYIPADKIVYPIPIGVAEFARLYTLNQLTLAQAVLGMTNWYMQITSGGMLSEAIALNIVGHRMHPTDLKSVEIGYDGSVKKWLDAGNEPIGWYALFQDNYKWYIQERDGTCTRQDGDPETKMTAAVALAPVVHMQERPDV